MKPGDLVRMFRSEGSLAWNELNAPKGEGNFYIQIKYNTLGVLLEIVPKDMTPNSSQFCRVLFQTGQCGFLLLKRIERLPS